MSFLEASKPVSSIFNHYWNHTSVGLPCWFWRLSILSPLPQNPPQNKPKPNWNPNTQVPALPLQNILSLLIREQQSEFRLLHLALLAAAVDRDAVAVCQSAYSSLMIRKGGQIYRSQLTHVRKFLNQITPMLLKMGRQLHRRSCHDRHPWTISGSRELLQCPFKNVWRVT